VNKEQSLLKINKELDNFVYKVSHDLRAPISTSLGLVGLLKNETGTEQHGEYPYVHLIDKSLHKLDNYIQDVLEYARNARTEIIVSDVNIKAFILDCRDELSKQSDGFELHCDEHLVLSTDPVRLKAILANLLSNAFKFKRPHSKESHSVEVSVSPTSKGVDITVRDNGEGIKEEYQEKIFEMFFRATDTVQGTGLGLYIVKENLASINGELTFESTYGTGTTFTLEIPNLKTN
jgi:signal transduction histidine kinase